MLITTFEDVRDLRIQVIADHLNISVSKTCPTTQPGGWIYELACVYADNYIKLQTRIIEMQLDALISSTPEDEISL